MFALLKFTERIYYDNNVSGESSEMPPPSRRPIPTQNQNQMPGNEVQCLLEPMSNNSISGSTSSTSLAEELSNGTRLRKSLDLSTSTPVTSRKPEEVPSASTLTTTYMRRPSTSTTSVTSDIMAPLSDLSSVSAGNRSLQ